MDISLALTLSNLISLVRGPCDTGWGWGGKTPPFPSHRACVPACWSLGVSLHPAQDPSPLYQSPSPLSAPQPGWSRRLTGSAAMMSPGCPPGVGASPTRPRPERPPSCLIAEGSRGDPHHQRVDGTRKGAVPLRVGVGRSAGPGIAPPTLDTDHREGLSWHRLPEKSAIVHSRNHTPLVQ